MVFTLVGSHVDSPRLDLKPNPLYEDAELSTISKHIIMAELKNISGQLFR